MDSAHSLLPRNRRQSPRYYAMPERVLLRLKRRNFRARSQEKRVDPADLPEKLDRIEHLCYNGHVASDGVYVPAAVAA